MVKELVKALKNYRLLKYLTFDYQSVQKDEMLERHLHAKVEEGKIISYVGGFQVSISAEDICNTYELPLATDVEVRSHTFNEKELWAVIKNDSQSTKKVPLKGKNKDISKPIFECTLDIVYKCLESRVAGVNDVNSEKFCLLSSILNDFKCD